MNAKAGKKIGEANENGKIVTSEMNDGDETKILFASSELDQEH